VSRGGGNQPPVGVWSTGGPRRRPSPPPPAVTSPLEPPPPRARPPQPVPIPRGRRRVACHPAVRAVVADERLKVGQQGSWAPISLGSEGPLPELDPEHRQRLRPSQVTT